MDIHLEENLQGKRNIYFDEKINNRLRGVSRAESLEIILERYHGTALTAHQKEEMMTEKNSIYRELLSSMTPADVSVNVRDTLKKLREKGYKLAIGSSSKNTKYILEKVNLTDCFDAISDGTNIQHSKPDPEVFLKAAEFLEEAPKECVVIEDAFSGIDAAKAAGMVAVGIGDAVNYEKSDFRIQSLSELLSLEFMN